MTHDTSSKRALYDQLVGQVEAVLEGLDDDVAVMATVCAVLYAALPEASFVGFYRVVAPDRLLVGPYQGPLACLEIRFGRGVCGTAAQLRATQVVPDVEAFPGHIACDPKARSEIVIPVDDADGELIAVLDLDSPQPGAFDELDRDGLERVAAAIRRHLPG